MNLESLQSRRAWLAGGAVLAVLVVAASYFLVILPKLSSASDTRTQASDNDVSNTQLVARQGTLARKEKNISAMRASLASALNALPPTSALPEFTHEVTQAAASTRVTLLTIGIGTVTAVTSTSAAPAASTASATPAAASSAQYQVGVTLTTTGSIGNQLAFVKAIETGPRRALLTSTSFSGIGNQTSLSAQLNIFTTAMTDQQVAQLRKLLTAG